MVRHAITSDIPGIQTLMQTIPGFWQPWWSEKTIGDAMESANGLAFVWEDNSQILGFVCAHDLGFRAYLSELVVDTGIRRQVSEHVSLEPWRKLSVTGISEF